MAGRRSRAKWSECERAPAHGRPRLYAHGVERTGAPHNRCGRVLRARGRWASRGRAPTEGELPRQAARKRGRMRAESKGRTLQAAAGRQRRRAVQQRRSAEYPRPRALHGPPTVHSECTAAGPCPGRWTWSPYAPRRRERQCWGVEMAPGVRCRRLRAAMMALCHVCALRAAV